MKPKKIIQDEGDLFRSRLSNQIKLSHELVHLSQIIDWAGLEEHFSALFTPDVGHPPKAVRLIVGLLILQHTYNCSDEEVIIRWIENPYWQYFCGYDFLQTEFPAHPTSLTRWRKRLGEKGLEKIFSYTIRLGVGTGTVKAASLSEVTVDTTVMPKNITYPTDAKLLYRGIQRVVAFAQSQNIPLRQSYKRVAKRSFLMAHRYAHARQMRRCYREQRRLKTYLGLTFLEKVDKNLLAFEN